MAEYWNEFQLLNSKRNPDVEENSPLYTYELDTVLEAKGKPHDHTKNALKEYFELCMVREGLFNQFPYKTGTGDDYMSHDQLSVIAAYSYKYGLSWHKDIWKEIKRQHFRYNNVEVPETFWEKLINKRVLHPRDILYIGYLAGDPICKLLSPLLYLIMWQSCKKRWKVRPTIWFRVKYFFVKRRCWDKNLIRKMEHTDGKLLTIVRCKSAMDRWMMRKTYKVCSKIIEDSDVFVDWNHVFGIYFRHDPEHPILKELADFSFS